MRGGGFLLFVTLFIVFFSGCIQQTQEDQGKTSEVKKLEEKAYVKADVNRILDNISYKDPAFYDKAEQLASLGPAAAPTLLNVMKEGDEPKKEVAAYALSNVVFGLDEDGKKSAGEDLKGHFSDENGFVRITSAGVAVALGDSSGIPILIEYLRSTDTNMWSDPPEPYSAYSTRVLTAFTGLDFGFDPNAPPSEREQSVQQWEAWWNANKNKLVWDPNKGDYGMYVIQ